MQTPPKATSNSAMPSDGMARAFTNGGPASTGRMVMPLAIVPRGPAPAFERARGPLASDCAVGHEIRELRRAKMMTQKEVANLIGVTGAQLHRYETGATRIAASRLVAIAAALEVGPERLIGAASELSRSQAGASHHGGDDILDLIQIFSAIPDPKCRAAIMTVVRMVATQHMALAGDSAAAG